MCDRATPMVLEPRLVRAMHLGIWVLFSMGNVMKTDSGKIYHETMSCQSNIVPANLEQNLRGVGYLVALLKNYTNIEEA